MDRYLAQPFAVWHSKLFEDTMAEWAQFNKDSPTVVSGNWTTVKAFKQHLCKFCCAHCSLGAVNLTPQKAKCLAKKGGQQCIDCEKSMNWTEGDPVRVPFLDRTKDRINVTY